MNILEELKFYCETQNPVGALMLSGEWGCGKTYLIEKTLPEDIVDTCIVLRVSLFGLGTVNEIQAEVKKKWFAALSEEKGISEDTTPKIKKVIETSKGILGTIKAFLPDDWQNIDRGLASLIDLVPLQNTIGDKKVILVFDDLERSSISTAELLGSINEYCENQCFNIIIVANEDKILKTVHDKEQFSYKEIKEKVVQRVIHFTPDYDSVVKNIIKELSPRNDKYKLFLENNQSILTAILAGEIDDELIIESFKNDNRRLKQDELKKETERLRNLLEQRPHNIRSLKCAIQDFERIYTILVELQFENCEIWLSSFVAYMMVSKAGLIIESQRYNNLFSKLNVEKLYPGFFETSCMVSGIEDWVCCGDWDENRIRFELSAELNRSKAKLPIEIVKSYLLPEVDDSVIKDGYPELLRQVYNGDLTLDEYVLFIENSYYARKYKVALGTIEWSQVQNGIRLQMKRLIADKREIGYSYRMISEKNKELFTDEKWESYCLIQKFRDNDVQIYENNQRIYIELLQTNINKAYQELGNKRYNALTQEMVDVSFEIFKNSGNANKNSFSMWFEGMWHRYKDMQDINIEITEKSLMDFKEKLSRLCDDYKKNDCPIALMHTIKFIEIIKEILLGNATEE